MACVDRSHATTVTASSWAGFTARATSKVRAAVTSRSPTARATTTIRQDFAAARTRADCSCSFGDAIERSTRLRNAQVRERIGAAGGAPAAAIGGVGAAEADALAGAVRGRT